MNHEVAAPERIIGTCQSVFLTIEDRDGMLQSGMEEGVNDSYNSLDELLKEMQK